MNEPGYSKCCVVVSMFGYSLRQGIFIVCSTTMLISAIAVVASMVTIYSINDPGSTKQPVGAAGMLFALYCVSIATYQILISGLLLWNTYKTEGSLFICSLWYISHLSIIVLYLLFFIGMSVAFFSAKKYVQGVFTVLAGILYTALFSFFCTVVNSYSHTIQEIIYY